MIPHAPILVNFGFLLFSTSVAGIGLHVSPIAGDLQLSAEFGLNPDLLLNNRAVFHSLLEKAASSIPAEYVKIPIDHENPSFGTYENRFWVNDAYYAPGRPIFIYDAGETDGERSLGHLTSGVSFFHNMIQEFRAMGILWEHRYYGDSLPYPINNTTPPEHFKYLTTKQALADIPFFAKNFSRPNHPNLNLTPGATPWIMVGGSYSGSRAAFTRDKYPDTIYAAFASSAPIQAQINMSSYYDQVYRGMVASGLGNCAQDLHSAIQYIDLQLSSSEETAAAVKKLFFGPGAELNSNGDFTAALTGAYGYFQSYGIGGGEGGLSELCRHLELDPITNKTAGPNGLAPVLGSQYVAERWASFPALTKVANLNLDTNCRGLDSSIPPSCELNKLPTDPSTISWFWQYCSEWGFYQSVNVGVHSLVSSYQTLEFDQKQCNDMFPDALERGILPSQPQTQSINDEYGGWFIRPSNTYFSAGEFDPWRTLSILSTENFAPQGVTLSTSIPGCGLPTDQDRVFAYVGKNSVHCFDFQTGTSVGEQSRSYFIQALKEWLPCFQQL